MPLKVHQFSMPKEHKSTGPQHNYLSSGSCASDAEDDDLALALALSLSESDQRVLQGISQHVKIDDVSELQTHQHNSPTNCRSDVSIANDERGDSDKEDDYTLAMALSLSLNDRDVPIAQKTEAPQKRKRSVHSPCKKRKRLSPVSCDATGTEDCLFTDTAPTQLRPHQDWQEPTECENLEKRCLAVEDKRLWDSLFNDNVFENHPHREVLEGVKSNVDNGHKTSSLPHAPCSISSASNQTHRKMLSVGKEYHPFPTRITKAQIEALLWARRFLFRSLIRHTPGSEGRSLRMCTVSVEELRQALKEGRISATDSEVKDMLRLFAKPAVGDKASGCARCIERRSALNKLDSTGNATLSSLNGNRTLHGIVRLVNKSLEQEYSPQDSSSSAVSPRKSEGVTASAWAVPPRLCRDCWAIEDTCKDYQKDVISRLLTTNTHSKAEKRPNVISTQPLKSNMGETATGFRNSWEARLQASLTDNTTPNPLDWDQFCYIFDAAQLRAAKSGKKVW